MSLDKEKSSSFATPLRILAVIGVIVSFILLEHHVRLLGGFQQGSSACSVNEHLDCDKVAASAYSELFSIPVASYGMLFCVLLFLVLHFGHRAESLDKKALWNSAFALIGPAVLVALGLLAVSAFSIQSFCPFCLVFDSVLFVMLVVLLRTKPEGSLIAAFGSGLVTLSSFCSFGLASAASLSRASRIVSLLLVASAAFIFLLPSLLVTYYHVPLQGEMELQANQAADLWVQEFLQQEEVDISLFVRQASPGDYVRGPLDAPFTVIEFADFQCGHCQKASAFLKQKIEEHPGKLRLIFKNFPLDNLCNPVMKAPLHRYACEAAVMSRCAGEQGREFFWDMHDAIFSLPQIDSTSLKELPVKLGLDSSFFDLCMMGPIGRQAVTEDIELGIRLKVAATPALFLYHEGRMKQLPNPQLLEPVLARLQ